MQHNTTTIEISTRSIIRIVVVIIGIILIWMISDILFSIFVAIIVASALEPWVAKMQSLKVPRGVSVLTAYLLALCIVIFAIGSIIPPLTSEISQLIKDFPDRYKGFIDFFSSFKSFLENNGFDSNIKNLLQSAESSLSNFTGGFFNALSGFFGGLFGVFVVIVLAFYFSTSEEAIKKLLKLVIPPASQDLWFDLISKAQQKIGWWFRGQLILSLAIFILSFVGLLLLGVKYALVLAFLAGLLEIVPVIGPVLSAVPAIFLTALYSPSKALFVFILFVLIQQFENNVLVPKVMQKSIGLHPIVIIIAMLVGIKLGGLAGALISLPAATALDVIISHFYPRTKSE